MNLHVCTLFVRYWDKEVQKAKKRGKIPHLTKAIILCYWKSYLVFGVFTMIEVSGVKCHRTYFLANSNEEHVLLDCMTCTGDFSLDCSENLVLRRVKQSPGETEKLSHNCRIMEVKQRARSHALLLRHCKPLTWFVRLICILCV